MRSRFRDSAGSVTAEFAIALPAVVLVLACCLSGLQVVGEQLRLQDAAAAAARSIARGDSGQAVAERLVPGATLQQSVDGDLVCATISTTSRALVGAIAGIALSATSCALGGGR